MNNNVTGIADIISGLSNVLPVNVITILMNRTINSSGNNDLDKTSIQYCIY